MSLVRKYRMSVQARTDLTEEEIAKYQSSMVIGHSPMTWPWRETGDIVHARRKQVAKMFYRAMKQIPALIKIKAERMTVRGERRRNDAIALRAWRGFRCLSGAIDGVEDEVKHFALSPHGETACGIRFQEYWPTSGKPECDECLAVAVESHPEMKQYL